MGWLAELGRRNVLRVAMAYLVTAWLLLQVTEVFTSALQLPEWLPRVVVVLLALGLPLTLLLAWMFEWTPEGPVRDRGEAGKRKRRKQLPTDIPSDSDVAAEGDRLRRMHRLDLAIIGVLSLMLAWHWFGAPEATEPTAQADTIMAEPASPAAQTRAIAVLPFAAMSEDPADGYFADGLTEEILNRLVGTKGLRVVGRTSSFAYRDRAADLREIARTLGVDVLLQGSVRRAGDQLRITAQLASGADGIQLWSRTYNHRLDDIFAVQDTVAADVTGQLALDLAPASPTEAITTRDPQAMALYLQAKAARGEYTAERISLALNWTLEALRLDPGFAEAHALLAMIELDQVTGGIVAGDRAIPRARKAIDRALELAPQSPSVLADAGRVLAWEADIGGGLQSIDRARQLNARALAMRPDDTDVMQRQVGLLTWSGDFEAARPLLDRLASTQELNPLHRELVAGFLIQFGRLEEARTLIGTLAENTPRRSALAIAAAGSELSIEQIHGTLIECIGRGGSGCYFSLALRYYLLGDDAHAIEALEAVPEAHAANRELARTWAMQMRGEWEAAREFTLQRFPELLDAASEWLVVLADQAVAQGDWARALQLWQRIEPGLFGDPPRTRMTANSAINVAYTLWQVENVHGARGIWQMLDAHFDAEPTFVHNTSRTLNAVLAAHALGFREKARDRLQAAIDAGFRDERLFEYTVDKTPFPAGEAARNDPLIAPLLAGLRERNRADLARLHAYLDEHGLPAVPVWKDPEPPSEEHAQQAPR